MIRTVFPRNRPQGKIPKPKKKSDNLVSKPMNDNRRGGSNIFWNLTVIHPCYQDILKTLFAPTGEPRFLAGNYGIDDDVIPLRSCISSCCSSCCCTLCFFFVEVCEDIFIMSKPTSGGMLKTWGKELALLGYSVGIAFSFLVFGYLQEKLAKGDRSE